MGHIWNQLPLKSRCQSEIGCQNNYAAWVCTKGIHRASLPYCSLFLIIAAFACILYLVFMLLAPTCHLYIFKTCIKAADRDIELVNQSPLFVATCIEDNY